MAFKKVSRNRQSDRKARGDIAPLPHSSWRLSPVNGTVSDIPVSSASEFWSRLGL